jgi:ADP-ribose pyrophosphatase
MLQRLTYQATFMNPNADADDEVLLRTSRFSIVRRRRLTAGGTLVTRETVQHPGAVVILPLLEHDRVCLVRNYRVAVRQTLIELPAGTLEEGESPLATAARELAEETGYTAARLAPLGMLLMSPGILNEQMHLFVATGLAIGEPSPEPGEEIERLIVLWDEALAMVDDGRIQDAKTVAALLRYDRQRLQTDRMRNAE